MKFLLEDSLYFTIAAGAAFEKRLGKDEALKRVAQGKVWDTINGGKPFQECAEHEDYQSDDDVEDEPYFWRDYPRNHSHVERWCHTYRENSWRPLSKHWAHLLPDIPETIEFYRSIIAILLTLPYETLGKAYITTDSGYIGRSGTGVQEGDILCIIFGCSLPAILRPAGGNYTLVSFAWVLDAIEGELLRDDEHVCRECRRFTLRN